MDKKPKISVVIATYNRGETIPQTLECLARQSISPDDFEVIVVDDGSPDNTEDVIASQKKILPYPLTYLKHKNQGICYTQNRGIRTAKGPIVLLITDDIFLEPENLAAHLDDHQKHPQLSVAVLGKVLQSPSLSKHSVFLKKWDPFKFRHLKSSRELPYYMFWACQISCKKDFLMRHGLFDENLVSGGADGHEDVELGCRLARQGLRILYNSNALGYHHHVMTWSQAIRKYYKKGLTWGRFRRKVDFPEISVRYHVLNRDTITDYIETFRRPDNLIGADKYPLWLILRHLGHAAVFNTLTVRFFWLPLHDIAEKNRFFENLMSSQIYRGVLFHYFFKGVNDKRNGRLDKKLASS